MVLLISMPFYFDCYLNFYQSTDRHYAHLAIQLSIPNACKFQSSKQKKWRLGLVKGVFVPEKSFKFLIFEGFIGNKVGYIYVINSSTKLSLKSYVYGKNRVIILENNVMLINSLVVMVFLRLFNFSYFYSCLS